MQLSQLEQQDMSTVLKLFGALFYYAPKDYDAANVTALLQYVDSPVAELNALLKAFQQTDLAALQQEHDRLFAGLGEMPAPPWGSAYIDKEAVLFGESTIVYRHFLQQCGFVLDSDMREPEDQIGLMLMVLGMLLEAERNDRAKILLAEHLMPWFDHFHQRFHAATTVNAYRMLSETTAALLQALCARDGIVVALKRDYRDVEY